MVAEKGIPVPVLQVTQELASAITAENRTNLVVRQRKIVPGRYCERRRKEPCTNPTLTLSRHLRWNNPIYVTYRPQGTELHSFPSTACWRIRLHFRSSCLRHRQAGDSQHPRIDHKRPSNSFVQSENPVGRCRNGLSFETTFVRRESSSRVILG